MLKRSVLKVSTFLMLLLSVVMVFAACGKMEFKVDFIVDDAVYATINTNGEVVLEMPNDPEKDGYVFDKWYWDKNSWKKPFSANSLLDAPLSSNMSVYAKWTTPESVTGTQAEFAEFEKVTETEYSMKVSNSTASVSLGSLVTVNSRSSWTLSSDIYGNNTIAGKTATLAVGDNTYYVLVTAENGSTQLYTLKIRRRPVYSIIFDTKGGTAVKNQKVEEDSLAEAPTTTKTGYSFASWNYDFTLPVTEKKIVVASWTANTYKIAYNANGGDLNAKTADIVYDSDFTLATPTKRGYDFDGWYYGDVLVTGGVWNYDTDITLDAHWNATEYSVSYNLNGGVLNGNNPLKYTVESDNITLVNPTKEGYTFAGWTRTDITGIANSVTIRNNSIGDRTYTAVWEIVDYSINYNLNGGTNSEANPEKYNVASATITLENPTKLGYVFGGWYTSNDYNDDERVKVIPNGSIGNIELFAKWTPATYSIKFNKNNSKATGTMSN